MKITTQLGTMLLPILIFLSITFSVQATSAISSMEDDNAPDITGKYEFDRFGITGAYVITKTAEGIHIEKYDADKEYETIAKAGKYPDYIVGDYSWENSRAAFMHRAFIPGGERLLLYKVNSATLAVRSSKGQVGSFKKIQGSLSDLVNSKRADVSSLIGNWTVEGTNSTLRFTNGVDHDLQVRYGANVYQLDKEEGGVFEEFSGESRAGGEELSFKVLKPGRIKLNVSGTEVVATRNGGAAQSSGGIRASTQNTSTTSQVNTASSATTATTATSALSATDKLMFKAIKEVETEAVEEAIQAGANVNAKSMAGRPALHEAVLQADTYLIEALLDNNANLNATDRQGRTALDVAISKSSGSDVDAALLLLDRRPSISNYALDKAIALDNNTLLTALIDGGANKTYLTTKAIEKGNNELFSTLINNHSVSLTNAMFDTALTKNKIAIAEEMLEHNFNPNYAMDASIRSNKIDLVYIALEKGGNATNAMKYAIKKKDAQLATNAVTEHGADVTVGLNESVVAKNSTMAQLMLENGAKADTQMATVAKSGDLELLDVLLSNQGNPDLGLIPAATSGKSKAVALLLEYDANPEVLLAHGVKNGSLDFVQQALAAEADGTNEKYIAQASGAGHLAIVTALLESGALPDYGMMPATKNNKLSVVQKLLIEGAEGNSDALLKASSPHNNVALTKLFITAGANAQAGVGMAIGSNADRTLQLLIDNGAVIDNQKLLFVSVTNNSAACAKILLNEGLEAQYQDPASGKFLLHYAAEKSNAAMIRLLLEHEAEVDVVSSGSTPLHLAVSNRKGLAAVDALIQGGADVNATNGKGKKVLKIAKGNKIKKLLKEAGAVKK